MIAAEYYLLAFRDMRIMHFKKNSCLKCIYFQRSRPLVQDFFIMLCWIYMLISFWEPSHRDDVSLSKSSQTFIALLSIESIILVIFSIDMIFKTIFSVQTSRRNKRCREVMDPMLLLNNILVISMIADAITFYLIYPSSYVRFSRYLRPIKLVFESSEVRRTLRSLGKSVPQIVDVIMLIWLLTIIYAFIGNKLLPNDISGLTRESNFDDFWEAIESIYFFTTMSNYPGAVIPYFKASYVYLVYFYPFLIFTVFMLFPIPIAVVFDSFRFNRSKILLEDRLEQKEALFLCFILIDKQQKGYIDHEQWNSLIDRVYNHTQDNKKVTKVFNSLDRRNTGFINPEQFFKGCDLINSLEDIQKYIIKFSLWDKFRAVINRFLKLNKLVASNWFDLIMLIIILANTVVIILENVDTDQDTSDLLDQIDNYFVYIFILEFVIKIIGLGVTDYFKDNWNKFDFFLIISSLVMDVTVSFLKSARGLRSAKSLRFLRIARSPRALRMLRILNKVNFIRIIISSASTFQRLKEIIEKTLMCVTSFKRIMTIMFMTFYVYTLLCCEILHHSEAEEKAHQNDTNILLYAGGTLGSYQTFTEGMLINFQILTGSGWHYPVFVMEVYKGFWIAFILMLSFHLIITYVIKTVLLGMIWELFVIVKENDEDLTGSINMLEEISEENETEGKSTDNIPQFNFGANKRNTTTISCKNAEMIELQYSSLYKEMFGAKTCNEDVKSMKRFIRRKIEYDDLTKKKVVPKRQWAYAIYQSSITTDRFDGELLKLSSMVHEPKMFREPIEKLKESIEKPFVKRSFSCQKHKIQSQINRVVYNTEIMIFNEYGSNSARSDSKSGSDFSEEASNSFSEESVTKYDIYNESSVDALSSKSSVKEEKIDEKPEDEEKQK